MRLVESFELGSIVTIQQSFLEAQSKTPGDRFDLLTLKISHARTSEASISAPMSPVHIMEKTPQA